MIAGRALCAMAAAVLCGGCGGTTTSPSAVTPTSPVTETFASMLTAGGASSHSFALTQAGTITVTLTSVTPATRVGVGIGIAGGAPSCSLTRSAVVDVGGSVQLAANADPGTYCAEIYDPGTVADQVAFSMTVEHP
jgi:hypothetical protein